ncbi:hypothetical protein DSO57_1025180 [Entomophthora muscae]|uniref:Uncharacterized protein n=1 Tax=Entomophthora muscae TaxID=34485 RepID=A0ACC2TEI2_9FUNG|nr:hypothetical protein DSO57_1025180 [Entomophthora muscae]
MILKTIAGLGLGSLGILGNLLLLLAVYRSQAQWTRLNLQLVAPIAGFGLLGSLVVFNEDLLCLVMGNEEMFASSWFCPFFGTPLLILPCFVTVLVSGMALDRYLIVVRSTGIPCLWGWLCISILCGSFTATILANTIVYDIIPDSTMTYCRPAGSDLLASIIRYYSTVIVFVGLFIITFSYFGIYFHCRKTLATFHVLPDRYLIFPISYLVCLLPKFIVIVWGFFADRSEIPAPLLAMGPLGFVLLFIVNPCLVFAFHACLRNELLPRCNHPTAPEPLNASTKQAQYICIP